MLNHEDIILHVCQLNIVSFIFNTVRGEGLITLIVKKTACYEMLHIAFKLAGSCGHSNEPSGSMKGGKFLD
jgi:hypothetical protein